MTSIFDALTQLFTRWGIGLRYIQWYVAGVLGGYVGLAVLSVFLSSWGFQWLIWIFLAFYIFGVIILMTSPFLWGGIAGAAYARGQVGGQEGLSVEDGIKTIKDWGAKAIDGTAKFLLFYGAVPFVWTALFQTKGWEEASLAGLILLPTVIYFTLVRWPNGQSVFNVIGYILIAVVLIGVFGTIYNTIDRSVTDPVVLEAREDIAREEERLTKREQERYKLIKEALEHNKRHPDDLVRLTKDELDFYNSVQKRAADTPAAQVKSLISSAASAVTDEGSATTSTSANWLGKNWPILAGAVLIILIVVLIARRRKTVTATVTVAASPAASNNKLTRIVVEFILGLVVTIGLWVWWTSDPGYAESMSFTVYDRTPQKICGYPKFPKGGKLMFVLPDEKHGKISAQVVGSDEDINLATQIMVHGETKGRTFARRPDGQCVLVNWVIDSGWEDKLKVPVTVKVMIIRYHGIGVADWIMSQYYK